MKTALVLVPDVISIGLDMVITSKASKKEVFRAKFEFGKNPMGVHLSLIQVYISQDSFPHTCHFSLDWTIAVTDRCSSYLLPHSCNSLAQSASHHPQSEQHDSPPNQQFLIVLLVPFFIHDSHEPRSLCYDLPTLHHHPYLHSFRLIQ